MESSGVTKEKVIGTVFDRKNFIERPDTELLVSSSPLLYKEKIKAKLDWEDNQFEKELESLKVKHNFSQQRKAKVISETVDELLKSFSNQFNDKRHIIEISVPGELRSGTIKPTINYWIECNPEKTMAVDIFMEIIREYGWKPVIEGIDLTVKSTYFQFHYSGGTNLKIVCKLE